MPLFGLKNARKKLSSPSLSLGLRKTQSTGNIEDSTTTIINKEERPIHIIVNRGKHPSSDAAMVSILRTPNQPPTPPLQSTIVLAPVMEDEHEALATKLRDITACDMDLLLSLETQARMDVQEEKERKQFDSKPPRLIKFDIPVTPPRSRSPDPNFYHARQRRWSLPEDSTEVNKKVTSNTRLSRWSRLIKQQQQEEANHNKKLLQNHSAITSNSSSISGSGSEEELDDAFVSQQQISVGSKVKLFKRPLPIIGTVKYIGPVHFDTGEWLGIELDSRGKRCETNNSIIHVLIFIVSIYM
jgi:hypothetical protein